MNLELTSKNENLNKMIKKSFDACKTNDEKACVVEEYQFVQKRHWEEYYNFMLLMYYNLLTAEDLSVFKTSGTAISSYMLCTFFGSNDIEFMNDKNRKEVLYNTPLGFDLEISKKNLSDEIRDQIEDLVQYCASENNLIYTNKGILCTNNADEKILVMAVSKKTLTERDSQAITNDLLLPQLSQEDQEILKDIFLVKVFIQ